MKTILGTILWLFGCAILTQAQSPVPGAHGRVFDVSGGYAYYSLGPPPADRFGLNGADASFTLVIFRRFGVKLDLGYAHTANVLARRTHSSVLSYLGGPVLYPTIRKHYATYVEGLVGGAFVSSTLIPTGGQASRAFVDRMSWAFGSGVEVPFSARHFLSFRFGADYIHTAFFDSSSAVHGQNDYRTTASIVFFFGRGWAR